MSSLTTTMDGKETSSSSMPLCNSCHKAVALTRCSKCKSAAYCGRDCQARDWKLCHKHNCSASKVRLVQTESKGRCLIHTGGNTKAGDLVMTDLVVVDNLRRDAATDFEPLVQAADNILKQSGNPDVPVLGWLYFLANYLTLSTMNNLSQHKKPSLHALEKARCAAVLSEMQGNLNDVHPKMADNVRQCADMAHSMLPAFIYDPKDAKHKDTGVLTVAQTEQLICVFLQNAIRVMVQPGMIPAQDVYASGLCLRASFIEHSCVPNANACTVNGVLRLYALRDIAHDEPVSIAYRYMYAPTAERREELSMFYQFTCQCSACVSPDEQTRRFFCPRSTHASRAIEDGKEVPDMSKLGPGLPPCRNGTVFPHKWTCDSCGYKLTDEQIELYLFREAAYEDEDFVGLDSAKEVVAQMRMSNTARALHSSHYYVYKAVMKLLKSVNDSEKLSPHHRQLFMEWIIDALTRVHGHYGDRLANYQHSLAVSLRHEVGEPTKKKMQKALAAYNDAYRIRRATAGATHPIATRLKREVDSCARDLHALSK